MHTLCYNLYTLAFLPWDHQGKQAVLLSHYTAEELRHPEIHKEFKKARIRFDLRPVHLQKLPCFEMLPCLPYSGRSLSFAHPNLGLFAVLLPFALVHPFLHLSEINYYY